MKRTQEDAELECESSAPAKKPVSGTFALPSTAQLAHRPSTGDPRFLCQASRRVQEPKKTNPPNSFDPKAFVLHNSAQGPTKSEDSDEDMDSEEEREELARFLEDHEDDGGVRDHSKAEETGAFVVRPMATSLPARTILAVPTVAHTATNPFLEPAMTVADFGEYIAEYVLDSHRYMKAWTELSPGQFGILVHDPFHRNKMIEFHTEFMNIEGVLDGRKDWDLSTLPYEFFEGVMEPLRKTGVLAMKLSENRVCEWISVAARSCSESWRLLRKAEEAKEDVEQWPAVWENGMMV
ncbi:unnamed protein product [Zymoseptoria tritici ST99CH_3D7]|uniref:Uncharacterized protein n=1 Tax=Zymoseptoria tritici (strain ST99CH_3D7) TaxID=1276538 RepID=A0A1X7RZV5_ZYMT9|nr:unnamed protein product [Zymoseptoria tritici ST99CH_3D7]